MMLDFGHPDYVVNYFVDHIVEPLAWVLLTIGVAMILWYCVRRK